MRASGAALLALVALGLGLRLHGVTYGLPNVYNPDEVAIMTRALAFATGDLNPRNFVYPTLYFYVLFLWEGLFFAAGWLTGAYTSAADFERSFFVDPTGIYVAGRVLSALCGAATVWLTYGLGVRLVDRTAGLAGAAFLAVAPIAVRDAHYVKHDVPVTLLIAALHVVLASIVLRGDGRERTRDWAIAGSLAGLAISTHYYAAVVVASLGLTTMLAPAPDGVRGRLRRFVLAGAAAAAAFALTSPFLVLSPATAWADMVANRQIVIDRAVGPAGAFGSLPRYAYLLAADGLGWPAAIAAAAGIVLLWRRAWRRAALLGVFPAAFLLFIANTVPATRYLNPILPFAALAAGIAVRELAARAPRQTAVAGVLAAGLAIPALAASAGIGTFFNRMDTRSLALAFVGREIPAGATIVVQPYSVPLRMSHEGLVEALRRHHGDERRASIKFRRQLALDPYPAPAYRVIYLGRGGLDADKVYVDPDDLVRAGSLEPLRAEGVEFVVLKRDVPDPAARWLRDALDREGRRVASFLPWPAALEPPPDPFLHNTDARIDPRLERPGPAIDIWRLD